MTHRLPKFVAFGGRRASDPARGDLFVVETKFHIDRTQQSKTIRVQLAEFLRDAKSIDENRTAAHGIVVANRRHAVNNCHAKIAQTGHRGGRFVFEREADSPRGRSSGSNHGAFAVLAQTIS